MFGIGAIVAFLLSWFFWLASFSNGKLLTWQSMALVGLILLAVHVTAGWPAYGWPWRRRA